MLEIIFLVGMSAIYATLLTGLADATDFIYVPGGPWPMESPENPFPDRTGATHSRFVEGFLICTHPVTQAEYETAMQASSRIASDGDAPAQDISWRDAIAYCNARSKEEGLTPAYSMDGQRVIWDRSADGYRLPTEAEWAYACRGAAALPCSGPGDPCGGVREWTWAFRGDCNAPADRNLKAAACLRLVRNAEAVAGTTGPNCERKNKL